MINRSAAGRWFKAVLWLGILANLALALPTMLFPERMLAINGLPPASPTVWPSFSALLLILLSLFYMPAGVDPDRYRANAWLAVAARLVGAVFFIGFQAREYLMLGLVDLVFFIPEAILLSAALRTEAGPVTQMGGEPTV